ncbi:MAG: hypothetical protein QF681_01170 [Vicinamibacterales bacterium]|nr:hypothetical protein [Vicinamibacterales bacterium]
MSTINRLLFVCAGNICRSPMAEVLFRDRAQSHPQLDKLDVSSRWRWTG